MPDVVYIVIGIFTLPFLLYGCSPQEYICFINPEFKDEKLCYEHSAHQENDDEAINAAIQLLENIETPGPLVKLKGEMREKYTDEMFNKGLIKYYSNLTGEDLTAVISTSQYTAVYLNNFSMLFYSHDDNAFEFSFDSPIELSGAGQYFGRGFPPTKVKVSKDSSLCNIEKQGVLFLSPEKENFFHKEGETFCTYNGMAFIKMNDEVSVWPIDQLEKKGRTNHYVGFSSFLIWLNSNDNE